MYKQTVAALVIIKWTSSAIKPVSATPTEIAIVGPLSYFIAPLAANSSSYWRIHPREFGSSILSRGKVTSFILIDAKYSYPT